MAEVNIDDPSVAGQMLRGQTVVVIGGSAGIGFETARLARSAGAEIIVTGRNQERLEQASRAIGAKSSHAFDATDFERLKRFFKELPGSVDHILSTAGGPYYAPLAEIDFEIANRNLDHHLWLPLHIARNAIGRVRPSGTLLFVSGTGARRPAIGMSLMSTFTAGMPALVKVLALEVAPIRVNLLAAGFVDTDLSASLLGERLDERRDQLRKSLPIGRIVGPQDVGALAVHLMANTAVTGATFDIDGGQQLV